MSDVLLESIELMDDLVKEVQAQRDELRAVLAPLLDEPLRADHWAPDGLHLNKCVFCAAECPVLRKDELLGR